jgi:predicted nucleic acid-binding protein
MSRGGIVLVDSNVFIHLLRRGRDPRPILDAWIGGGDLATCGMVRLEVERGLKAPRLKERLGAYFDVLLYAPTPNRLWEEATQVAWQLDRRGVNLPVQDIVIAAAARGIGASVLTDDAHFQEIPGCVVFRAARELEENW